MPERLSIRGAKAKSIFEFFTACFACLHDRVLVPGLNYGRETSVFEKLPPREKSPRTNRLRAEASQLSAMRGDLNGYYGRRAESYEKFLSSINRCVTWIASYARSNRFDSESATVCRASR